MKYIPYILIALVLIIGAGAYLNSHSKGLNLGAADNSTVVQGSNKDGNSNINGMAKIEFKSLGAAPDFTGIDKWLNAPAALSIKDLKGKVVLVDFWTYSCVNCIRTLPYVTKWYDTYHDKGFVVVGVHTPEFPFEKVTSNVQDAIQRFNIHYPVAQDNSYATWNNYNNQFWPAEYLIDQNGNIVYTHFGEGNYDHTENAIRTLLGLNPDQASPAAASGQDLNKIATPEMYFGTNRLSNLSAAQQVSNAGKNYSLPQDIALNTFALGGNWGFSSENIKLLKAGGKIRLKFHAAKVHIVAEDPAAEVIHIMVDGKAQPDVTVNKSELYTLFDSSDYSDHILELTIPDAGFSAFTFTFG